MNGYRQNTVFRAPLNAGCGRGVNPSTRCGCGMGHRAAWRGSVRWRGGYGAVGAFRHRFLPTHYCRRDANAAHHRRQLTPEAALKTSQGVRAREEKQAAECGATLATLPRSHPTVSPSELCAVRTHYEQPVPQVARVEIKVGVGTERDELGPGMGPSANKEGTLTTEYPESRGGVEKGWTRGEPKIGPPALWNMPVSGQKYKGRTARAESNADDVLEWRRIYR